MKLLDKSWYFAIALLFIASCADDSMLEYDVAKPESIAEKEYLKEYDVLKSYVDRNENPDFKLGAGVSATAYSEQGSVYSLVSSNFDEITAGNAMKHSSVVQDDGSMDFTQVSQFVEAAKGANNNIYGHTLLWHAQQNNEFLNEIISDKEVEIDPDATVEVEDGTEDYSGGAYTFWSSDVVDPVVENEVLVVTNEEATTNNWDIQFHIADGISTQIGTKHKVTLRIKGSTPGDITLAMGDWGGQDNTTLSFTEEWQEVTVELTGTAESSFIMLQSGHYVGTYEIDWVKVTHEEAAAVSYWEQLVTNGDMEGDDFSAFKATEATDGPKEVTIGEPGTGADGEGRAIVVESGNNPANPWDTQFFVTVPHEFEEGERIRFSMKYRAEKEAGSESQAHNDPGGYLHWEMVGTPTFTPEWQEHNYTGTINGSQAGMNTIAFNLALLGEANTYYFDDISWEVEKTGNTMPLTPEEKADTLTYAMDKWIAGMMEATDDYVKSWDVVNEPLSGEDTDGDGYYDLKSAETGDAENNFYWQDYLGENYVRTAVALAREYGPSDMNLFVNDYNLESDWDDNQKVKSLIRWIEQWESDGETVIDGIGTQMHVSFHMDTATQASKEEHIVKMYELLAETGKLVKVTELDMGLVDAEGNTVMTGDVTDEQHNAMADFYEFIVRKYFEIIPANQRYGIAHWTPADSPEDSSWRGGEPTGLWTEDYSRKPAYAGFANGLAGEEVVNVGE